MPSTKHRINLTVPDEVYTQIKSYMTENGLANDATACLQLVVQQLRAYENGKIYVAALGKFSKEELIAMSVDGTSVLKDLLDKNDSSKK